jgi:D-alanyl-lipoteichoic acid acyltransferase DltB (MBOAT superfamily)
MIDLHDYYLFQGPRSRYIGDEQWSWCTEQAERGKYLALSLVINLGLLFTFKYFNFFNESLRGLFTLFDVEYRFAGLDVLLPVGISFYTFQLLSYVDGDWVGRRRRLGGAPFGSPQRNLLTRLAQDCDYFSPRAV